MKGGFIADFSHRHAAVAAGLGEFGGQGLLLTSEFGVRQRLCSIITNAPLTPDPLFGGPSLCAGCEACLRAYPVEAFHKTERHSFRIGDKALTYAKVDKWRCAWVEQLGMVGEGGPKYEGITTDVPPPRPGQTGRLPCRHGKTRSFPSHLRLGDHFVRKMPPRLPGSQAEKFQIIVGARCFAPSVGHGQRALMDV
jgi:hypothetical protein